MKRYTDNEINIIKQYYPNHSKEEMLLLLPNRTYQEIVRKAGVLGIKKSFWWSQEDIDKLKELYPTIDKESIIKYFDNRTYSEIQTMANKLKLIKDNHWSNDEIEKIKKYYPNSSKEELEKIFEKRTFSQIQSRANKLGIKRQYKKPTKIKKDKINKVKLCKYCGSYDIISKYLTCLSCKSKLNNIYKYKRKYNINLKFEEMYDTFSVYDWWKFTYYGTPNGRKMKQMPYEILANKDAIDNVFKYVIEDEMQLNTREKVLTISKKHFENYVLSGMLYKYYNSIYDLLTNIFPEYDIKPWELTLAINNCWDSKENSDDYMRWFIKEKLKINNIIDWKLEIPNIFTISELRKLNEHTLNHILHVKKYYDSYCEWLNLLYPELNLSLNDFSEHISRDGKKLNSKEELKVYEFIKYDMKLDILPTYKNKQNYKYFNIEENENYIPDFIITKLLNKDIIIEYFGLYRENANHIIFKNYTNKAKRKVQYFSNNNEIYFIDLYPNDLNHNFEGVKNKINKILI